MNNGLRNSRNPHRSSTHRLRLDLEDDTYDISVEIDYLGDVYLDAAPGVLVVSDL